MQINILIFLCIFKSKALYNIQYITFTHKLNPTLVFGA